MKPRFYLRLDYYRGNRLAFTDFKEVPTSSAWQKFHEQKADPTKGDLILALGLVFSDRDSIDIALQTSPQFTLLTRSMLHA